MGITVNEPYSVVVSLTSWRGRIYSEIVQLVLFSLLKQKTKYRYKVVLVLSEEEFPRKEAELPENIVKMAEKVEYMEILWTYRNTRALKKLDPTMAAYPDLPVITTDDDIIVKEDFVETFMDMHNRYPKDIIYAHVWNFPANPEIKISGMGRLFPPHSLYPLNDKLFDKCFYGVEDDVWNGIRVWLAGTKVRKLGSWPFVDQIPIGDTAFYKVYTKINATDCYKRLLNELKR
jgi:hypothetical protein